MNYNLEGRTLEFSKSVIANCKKVKLNPININLVRQLTRSATSIGANYCEANGAVSRADFKNKIHICKKEAQETRYWLELLSFAEPEYNVDIQVLLKECNELVLIFGKIGSSSK